MECPCCKNEVVPELLSSWSFREFQVKRFLCPRCSQKFNTYEQAGKVKFTVPKGDN